MKVTDFLTPAFIRVENYIRLNSLACVIYVEHGRVDTKELIELL